MVGASRCQQAGKSPVQEHGGDKGLQQGGTGATGLVQPSEEEEDGEEASN